MMSPADRRRVMLHQEGSALTNVAHHGTDMAAEYARATMDGLANALMRLEGVESAAGYLFALGDRVAGNLREPTDFRAPAMALPPPPDTEPPPSIEPRPYGWRDAFKLTWTPTLTAYLLGALHGALLAFVIYSARAP